MASIPLGFPLIGLMLARKDTVRKQWTEIWKTYRQLQS